MLSKKTTSTHKCSLCSSTFTRKSSFKRHIQNFHPENQDELISNGNKTFKCDKCNKTYSYINNLKQHERSVHKDKPVSNFQHECVFCEYTNCKRYNIVEHYEKYHQISIESEDLQFKDKLEFEKWKKEMEKETSSFFRKTCSYNDPRNGFKKERFFCNRSGYYEPKGKGVRKMRTQGTLKIGGICPAEIDIVVYDDNRHFVKYVKTHCGHENNYQDLHLSRDQKESIAVKIATGVPNRVILDEVRDSLSLNTKVERAQNLSRKDLYNIAKCFQLENTSRVAVDGLSIEEWVKEMNQRGSVLYYKLKGSFCNLFINLRADDFVIIIMNQSQLEILQKHASKCICMDRTHFLNTDRMELISMLVVDDENEGFPCAFLISNRIDNETISLFYTCIKEKIGKSLKTNIFMSDIDSIFYNCWVEVMDTPKFRLLCPWHVEKCWRDIVQKIKSSKRQAEAYEHLKFLQNIEDEEDFEDSLDEFLDTWTLAGTIDFSLHFQIKFMDNRRLWAQYYKTQKNISLSSNLKQVHEEISKLFVFGKNNNRLNLAVTSLMNFAKDKLLEKLTRNEGSSQNNASTQVEQNIMNRK